MITYSARTVDGETITVQCISRDAALDMVEGDLLNGLTPVMLELYGVRLGVSHILGLVFKRRAAKAGARCPGHRDPVQAV